jgi:xylulokinase
VFLGHDLGTGGDKAVLVDGDGRVVAEAFHPYGLDHPRPGWAEQDPAHYWEAVCATTRTVLADAGCDPADVAGVGYAGQMLTMVPLDAGGVPTRRAISWLDARATDEAARITRRLGGARVVKMAVGAVPSAKDVVAKWMWIRRHEPAVWARTAALTDATGYLVARSTGVVCADHTAGGGTGMINRTRRTWSKALLSVSGMASPRSQAKLPTLRGCAEVVGGLTDQAAFDLGLVPGTPVVAGVGDVPAAQVGSGAVLPGAAHVCLGTSAWLCVTTTSVNDIAGNGVYSLPAADLSTFATVGEMETAGECLDWLAALLDPDHTTGGDGDHGDGVGALVAVAGDAPAGCDGLTFAPWLYGERAPVNDTTLRGALLGMSLDHTRAHVARAVLEGVAHNLRWLLEVMAASHMAPTRLRVIGGGVRSDLWMQIIADVTGLAVDTVDHPQYAGARGAALLAAVGTGALRSVAAVADLTAVAGTFHPNTSVAAAHDRGHAAFRAALPAAQAHARALSGHPGAW